MESLTGYNIGFIGLGLMGRHMCLNLHRAGANLYIYNRSRQVLDDLQQERMTPCGSPAEVGRAADIIILMVSDTPAVEQVLFDDNGLAQGLQPNKLVIDMGTTAAVATRGFAQRLQEQGVDYIDAPVSGGEPGARDGKLTIMAGGTQSSIERVQPIFDVLGTSFTHIGDVGTGQIAKAANQIIVGLNIGAVAEALALAKKAGADPARVREALLGGYAASRILEVHGQRMIDNNFTPGAKATTQHKDMSQAIELGSHYHLELPITELGKELYKRLIEGGGANLDHSALIKVIEKSLK
jgi:3-hydroxyisobutyrate dehydrogenase-like beta-hydroxyacid dehydrogenase